MKVTKVLLTLMAGVGLFACKSEEFGNDVVAIDGPAAITLNIQSEGMDSNSRKTGDFTNPGNANIEVQDLIVRFLGERNDNLETRKIDRISMPGPGQKVTMFNVPKGTVRLVVVGNSHASNGHDGNYEEAFSSEAGKETHKEARQTTIYGISDNLKFEGSIKGDGSGNGDANKNYAKYSTRVSLKPVTSRLEVGGLKFVPKPASNLETLTLKAVFMNGYYERGRFDVTGMQPGNVIVEERDYKSVNASNIDRDWGGLMLKDDNLNIQIYKPNELEEEDKTPIFPAGPQQQCYAYNFFVGDWRGGVNEDNPGDGKNLPKFTLKIEAQYSGTPSGPVTLYAVITKYKKKSPSHGNNEIKSFQAGKIYKITSLNLPEDVLTPDPEGNQLIAVEATVDVQNWRIEDIEGEWAGQQPMP